MRRAAALAAAVVALVLAGCSGGDAATPAPGPPPATGSGFFVGTGPLGLGATLDLEGRDRVTAAIEAGLRAAGGRDGRAAAVGVASVVNDGVSPVPVPAFIATFEGGGAVPLPDAADVLARARGAAARRALALLADVPPVVPPGGAATLYVVLRGAAVDDVASVRMVVEPGRAVTMDARRR